MEHRSDIAVLLRRLRRFGIHIDEVNSAILSKLVRCVRHVPTSPDRQLLIRAVEQLVADEPPTDFDRSVFSELDEVLREHPDCVFHTLRVILALTKFSTGLRHAIEAGVHHSLKRLVSSPLPYQIVNECLAVLTAMVKTALHAGGEQCYVALAELDMGAVLVKLARQRLLASLGGQSFAADCDAYPEHATSGALTPVWRSLLVNTGSLATMIKACSDLYCQAVFSRWSGELQHWSDLLITVMEGPIRRYEPHPGPSFYEALQLCISYASEYSAIAIIEQLDALMKGRPDLPIVSQVVDANLIESALRRCPVKSIVENYYPVTNGAVGIGRRVLELIVVVLRELPDRSDGHYRINVISILLDHHVRSLFDRAAPTSLRDVLDSLFSHLCRLVPGWCPEIDFRRYLLTGMVD
ncbi:hypothetical protein BIW11_12518 [Tropilaelaps mercedesae]|uniref:Uncharacterized protein n=1 Tax=Tropilaelaps mercedesae TaxID=418985 RepID=A0A1V9X6A6_9ACAR|nr:hypothetical protein BIW11_12518 [Tropilaelaps mercedesae]